MRKREEHPNPTHVADRHVVSRYGSLV